jgi:tetratricopeptide (TPR) repeat protein
VSLPRHVQSLSLGQFNGPVLRGKDTGKSTLYFAAGKAYDDMGDYSKAFGYFKMANDINNELHPFQKESFVERNERLREFSSPALVERCSGAGLDAVAPIFICGMPRSGTTLTEQMLSRHPEVQAGGEMSAAIVALQENKRLGQALGDELEDDEIVADDFRRLAEDYVSAVRAEGIRSTYFTDKMPGNHRHIGLLALALPRAKFLIMRRHPLDCLLSNYFQHFGQNQPFSSEFENMAVFFGQYFEDVAKWKTTFPDQVREVYYEKIVDATEAEARSILDFVGLEWTDSVLDHESSSHRVNTASISQVREPIYRRSVARWQKYEDNIGPLIELLNQHAPGALDEWTFMS